MLSLFRRRTFTKNQKVAWDTVETVEQLLVEHSDKLSEFDGRVLNLLQFACLYSHDMAVFVEEFALTKSPARRLLFARLISLHAIECFNDFSALLGKTFKDQVAQLSAHENLGEVVKGLRQLRQKHERLLRPIRNNVIAHRDLNAAAQMATIRALDLVQIQRMASEMISWHTKLMNALKPFAMGIRERVLHPMPPNERLQRTRAGARR